MTDWVIFLGPTLARSVARELMPDARIEPPVGHGDLYRAARDGARGALIIDGVFEQTASVWHKEALFALSAGVHVFGAASMGALRAAELDAFGVVGIGAIYRAFRDGLWLDDDEVAIRHGPAELGWPALSEAMADIRATVARAEQAGLLSGPDARRVIEAAKATPYPERSFAAALEQAGIAGAETVLTWWATSRRSAKADDAAEAIRTFAAFAASAPQRFEAGFEFEVTSLWAAAAAVIDGEDSAREEDGAGESDPAGSHAPAQTGTG